LVREPRYPPVLCADRRGILKQPRLLFLPRELGELTNQRMVWMKERLFLRQDGRVSVLPKLQALDLARSEVQFEGADQGRVRIRFQVRVRQIRQLAGMPVDLDQILSLDLSEERTAAPFVDAKRRRQVEERVPVDVERLGQEFPDRRCLACRVDQVRLPALEQDGIGVIAGTGVCTEERPNGSLEAQRKHGERRAFFEQYQGQVRQDILGAPLRNRFSLANRRDVSHDAKGALEGPETLLHFPGLRVLIVFRQSAKHGRGGHQ
jgi:hypothetical protein